MTMQLPAAVGDWLMETGIISQEELAAPPLDSYILNRPATLEFENGVRVARLLQALGSESYDTLKENNAPVAKLYNWNLLLPKLTQRGCDVDQDMKVLIVAGDTDIVVDLLKQLHDARDMAPLPIQEVQPSSSLMVGSAADASMPPPASAAVATSAIQFLAFCCKQELGQSWSQALHLAHNPRQLNRQQASGAHGAAGGFAPIVRWFKLTFAHCKHLAALCAPDPAETEHTLTCINASDQFAQTS